MEQNNQLKLNIKLDLKDYVRFNISHIYGKMLYKILTIVGVISILALPFLLYSVIGTNKIGTYIPLITLMLVVPLTMLVLIPFTLYMQSASIMASSKGLNQNLEYTFDNEGFSIKSGSETIKINDRADWTSLYKIIERKHGFYLYISKLQAYIIPKRVFKDDEEINSFRQLVKNTNLMK